MFRVLDLSQHKLIDIFQRHQIILCYHIINNNVNNGGI